MGHKFNYRQNMDIRYPHGTLIDIPALVSACTDQWFNQTLTRVNNSVVRLGILQGQYHWHRHEKEDEFFLVLSGRLLIDLPEETITLEAQQAVTISAGVLHRTRAPHKTVVIMVEASTIDPIGQVASGPTVHP